MAGNGGIQTSVGQNLVPAFAGDWCDENPRQNVVAGPGGLVAGTSGLIVGLFAWLAYNQLDGDLAPAVANNFGPGLPTGLYHRDQQGLLTQYLQGSSLLTPGGFQVALHSSCGMWVKNNGVASATYEMKAFANNADGTITFAAAGTTPAAAASATGSIAAGTGSATGVINGNIFTATAGLAGSLNPGGTLSGTGVAAGTKIVAQVLPLIGGEALTGLGRYIVSIPNQTVASTTISETHGIFTAASVLTGAFGLNQILTGTGISVTTRITAFGTGTGGLGTYIVDVNTVVASATISAGGSIETKFVARSFGAPGELVKISSQLYG